MVNHGKVTEKPVNSSIGHSPNCTETGMAVAFKKLMSSVPRRTGQEGSKGTRAKADGLGLWKGLLNGTKTVLWE